MPGFLHSRGFKLLLIVIILFAGYKFYVNYQQIEQLNQQLAELNHNIAMANEQQDKLQEELKNIDNPAYIEKIARKELGLVKPGELLLIPVAKNKETQK